MNRRDPFLTKNFNREETKNTKGYIENANDKLYHIKCTGMDRFSDL